MDKYVKLAKIGQGSFGSAFVVAKKTEPSGKKYVIKEVRVDPRDQQSALREAKLLAALDHPNIIACKESFLLPPPTTSSVVGGLPGRAAAARREQVLCIVTEFADGGDLRKSMQQRQGRRPRFFQEHEVLDLFVQVCLALKHLHDRKIIHRDIKPENIFLSGANVVKLGDFGVATMLSHTLASAETLTGTPYYTSPEICLGKRYNSKTDVWSLGCVLYELATFAHPFDGRSQRQLFDNIIRANYTPVAAVLAGRQVQYSAGLSAIVDGMLMKNPRDRPSVSSLLKTPIVMARIQRFLSERAIADELNHTVLHGHDIFRKNVTLPPAPPAPSRGAPNSHPAPVVKAVAYSPPPAPITSVKRAVATPTRGGSGPRKDINARKALPSPAAVVARAKAKNAVLRHTRSLKKRGAQTGAKAAASPFRSPLSTKKAASPANAARTKVQAAPASVSPQAIKAVALNKGQPKRATPVKTPANKEAAGLPEPPPTTVAMAKPPQNAIASRVARFNAQWQAQHQELMNHIAAPPPPPPIAVPVSNAKQPSAAGKAYPKPVVIQVQGHSAGSSSKLQPSSKGASINVKKKKAVVSSRDGIRQHIRAKKKELARVSPACVLNDPIILVQNLPDLSETTESESLPSLHDEKQPSKSTSQASDSAVQSSDAASKAGAGENCEEVESEETDGAETSAVHPWPAPPTAENLEFERMVLQLRSVVEAANNNDDGDDTNESDSDENEDDDQLVEKAGNYGKAKSRLLTEDSPPPPYSSSSINSTSPLTLDMAVLEQDAFKQALHSLMAHPEDAARTAEALAGLAPAHHQSLLWMRDYVAKITKMSA